MATKTITVKKVLDPERKKQLKESFDLFDKDASGDISVAEIYKIMRSFGNKLSRNEIKEMVNQIDTSGDGNLDFEEFCTFFEQVEVAEEQPQLRGKKKEEEEEESEEDRVIRAFMTFDMDNKGKITNYEFRHILEDLGYKLPRKFVDQFFMVAQKEDDGETNYRDFVHEWKQYPSDYIVLQYAKEH